MPFFWLILNTTNRQVPYLPFEMVFIVKKENETLSYSIQKWNRTTCDKNSFITSTGSDRCDISLNFHFDFCCFYFNLWTEIIKYDIDCHSKIHIIKMHASVILWNVNRHGYGNSIIIHRKAGKTELLIKSIVYVRLLFYCIGYHCLALYILLFNV